MVVVDVYYYICQRLKLEGETENKRPFSPNKRSYSHHVCHTNHRLSRTYHATVLRHRPLGLGLCLGLEWMQPLLLLYPLCLCV